MLPLPLPGIRFVQFMLVVRTCPLLQWGRQSCSSGNEGREHRCKHAGLCVCPCLGMGTMVKLQTWSQVSKVFSTLLLSLEETNTHTDPERYMYCIFVHISTRPDRKLLSIHPHTHLTDKCERNTDAHTYTRSHTPQGPWPPFHGCLSHILLFCLVSLPAKTRKEDGQDEET